MSGNITPQVDGQLSNDILKPNSHNEKNVENGEKPNQVETDQGIFADQYAAIMNQFSEACDKNGVEIALAIIVKPNQNQPMIYISGQELEVGLLLAAVLRDIKSSVVNKLTV